MPDHVAVGLLPKVEVGVAKQHHNGAVTLALMRDRSAAVFGVLVGFVHFLVGQLLVFCAVGEVAIVDDVLQSLRDLMEPRKEGDHQVEREQASEESSHHRSKANACRSAGTISEDCGTLA